MPSKVMNLIGEIKTSTSTGTVRRNPRGRPMYGRKGVTMGQHIDEFDDFRDEQGRSFDELVYFMLFDKTKVLMPPPPKPQVSKVMPSQTTKVDPSQKNNADVDDYLRRLRHAHRTDIQKRVVANPDLKRKREEGDELEKKSKPKTQAAVQGTASEVPKSPDKVTTTRMRPGPKRYF
ncbi:uncharacterized protein K460DRAFT_409033 [Cucurbitaria berberidis CBS 394.84]|uniref:Uncharacterized protein n=1 Tax=Cucurbitaria berberidis CBS 394.84 TaxID=1168544 RepID=A0A9P4G9E3_9PLEO|nr:uncharacterized protein K460DRAFT_409033 [Cucurbitaria berberidis CBS 394.84]KAF1841573.1 hypothetical protein K460DRAFT_409033 [Cucurbitaria berberidis CBS 394.84]